MFDEDTKLQCRMDHAKALTKTVLVEGLTPQVEVIDYGIRGFESHRL